MFMMQWSCPDIFNTVLALAKHMTAPREAHAHALMTIVKYGRHTKDRGLILVPKYLWSTRYSFKIHGRSDSDYATNSDDRRSISSSGVLVCSTPMYF